MKITIIGQCHLAYVTATCMEQYHTVNVDESNLLDSGVIWMCQDTPVDESGKPNPKIIVDKLDKILPIAKKGSVVLISSQVPVGTCREIQTRHTEFNVICSPENLRRGKAINDFLNPERIVIGSNGDEASILIIKELFLPISDNGKKLFFTTIESAEMIKHALNSFLAIEIAFINEIDKVCKSVGANSTDVTFGLQSDKRIGFLSYLKAGRPYTNDTLGREIYTLIELDNKLKLGLNLIPSIKKSNDEHRNNR